MSKSFDELKIGEVFDAGKRTITAQDIADFAKVSGDKNPLHLDDEYAKSTHFGGQIAHGLLNASIATGLSSEYGLFKESLIALKEMSLRFLSPVRPKDTLNLRLECIDLKHSSKPDRGLATFKAELYNQNGYAVLESTWVLLLKRKGEQL